MENKKFYTRPVVEAVKIDSEISLIMSTNNTPMGAPDKVAPQGGNDGGIDIPAE